MGEKSSDKIIAFDTLFTTNTIQMLKVLITYMAPPAQKSFAVYIKLMELQYTLSFFNKHPDASLCRLPHEDSSNAAKLCEELLPFCDNAQKDKINQFKNMFQTLENMQEMMETLQMMKDLFPEGVDSTNGGMDMLSGLAGMSGMSGMPDFSSIDLSQIMSMLTPSDEAS